MSTKCSKEHRKTSIPRNLVNCFLLLVQCRQLYTSFYLFGRDGVILWVGGSVCIVFLLH